MAQNIIFTQQVGATLDGLLRQAGSPSCHVLADENTAHLVLPCLQSTCLAGAPTIVMPPGDDNKDLTQLSRVWQALSDGGATRDSLLINVGGGVVTDLGGMAAATFKRGIRFINVPTTLLAAVDASVGGKTGINFNGLKNEVGAFALASDVLISTCFFATLPRQELRSGYAELIKHGLLQSGQALTALLDSAPEHIGQEQLLQLLRQSVVLKQRITESDPHESGQRRVLNLGHTVGHALEAWHLQRRRPVPHGYAVAWGLVVELVLSHMLYRLDSALLHRVSRYVRDHYGAFALSCDDYPDLLALMRHDKKSHSGEVNCTLLRHCGDAVPDCVIDSAKMEAALDIFRDLMGV